MTPYKPYIHHIKNSKGTPFIGNSHSGHKAKLSGFLHVVMWVSTGSLVPSHFPKHLRLCMVPRHGLMFHPGCVCASCFMMSVPRIGSRFTAWLLKMNEGRNPVVSLPILVDTGLQTNSNNSE